MSTETKPTGGASGLTDGLGVNGDDEGSYRSCADAAHAALDRMARAHKRGTGCHLTEDMIHALSTTSIGEMWEDTP